MSEFETMTSRLTPLPRLEEHNRAYFRATPGGKMVLQRCTDCSEWIFYPRVSCPNCLSMSLEWREIEGQGEIDSFAIVHRPQHSAFLEELPIILVAVRLDEGPTIVSALVGASPRDVKLGQRVASVLHRSADDVILPKFRLIQGLS